MLAAARMCRRSLTATLAGYSLLGMLVAVTPLGAAATRASPQFQDPLDTPAVMVRLAAQECIQDIARAGDRLVAVGQRGTILISDDAGQHWGQVASPVSSDLTAVNFPTESEGWAVGHDGVILRSGNGGKSWSLQTDGRALDRFMAGHYRALAARDAAAASIADDIERRMARGALPSLFGVWFADARSGFAVGSAGLVLATDDGGENWTPWIERTENAKVSHIYAIAGAGGPLGEVYLAGELGFLARLDRSAGRFVQIASPYEGTFFSVSAAGDQVLIGGLRGNLLWSANRGTDWQSVETATRAAVVAAKVSRDGSWSALFQDGSMLRGGAGDGRPPSRTEPLNRFSMAFVEAAPGIVAVATDNGPRRVTLGNR